MKKIIFAFIFTLAILFFNGASAYYNGEPCSTIGESYTHIVGCNMIPCSPDCFGGATPPAGCQAATGNYVENWICGPDYKWHGSGTAYGLIDADGDGYFTWTGCLPGSGSGSCSKTSCDLSGLAGTTCEGIITNAALGDNCPSVSNPSQADSNGDGVGDACTVGTEDNSNHACDNLLFPDSNCLCADGIDNNGNGQIDCADTSGGADSCSNSPLCQCLTGSGSVTPDCCALMGYYGAVMNGMMAWGDNPNMFRGQCNSNTAFCHDTGETLSCVETTDTNAISIPYKTSSVNCDNGAKCCTGLLNFPVCNFNSGGGGGGTGGGNGPPPNPPGPTPCTPGDTVSVDCEVSTSASCTGGERTSTCRDNGTWSSWSDCDITTDPTACSTTTVSCSPTDCNDGDSCTTDICDNGNCIHNLIANCGNGPHPPSGTPVTSWKIFTLSYIDSPLWGASYSSNVLFNASNSYTINVSHYSDGNVTVVCLAGNCPVRTEGLYNGAHIAVDNTPNWAGFSNLNFTWKIDGVQTVSGMGWLGSNFSNNFLIPRQHNATLNVSFGNSSGFNKVIFLTSQGIPRCSASSTSASWLFNNGAGDFILNPFYCYNSSGVDDLTGVVRTSCCPTGQLCNISSGVCGTTAVASITRCSNYNITNFVSVSGARAACNGDIGSVGIFSVEEIKGQNFCGSTNYVSDTCTDQVTGCGCYWNDTTSSCDSTFSMTENGTGCPNGVSKSCSYTATNVTDDCANSGTLIYHATAYGSLAGTSVCEDRNVPGLCAKSLMQLPFFTWINFVIVVIILVIFYLLFRGKRSKKSRKK